MAIQRFKGKILGWFYVNIARPVFFMFDPELMHRAFVRLGSILGRYTITKKITKMLFDYEDKRLEQKILGINFRNPIGLAAGFDKNMETVEIMEDVGFGFVEVGSVTAKACEGNKGKRLGRIVNQRGIWVNMGLNNKGADKYVSDFKSRRNIPIGVSVAKTNCKETAEDNAAIKDYIYTLRKLKDYPSYFTINISCPNSYGGQPFSRPKKFEKLIEEVMKLKIKKPILIKLSPDLKKAEIDKILKISEKYDVSGFVCSNITKDKRARSGGFSGKMVEKKSNELLSYVYEKTKGKKLLIGVGGVFSAEDAYKKIKLGANLVQLITGMIYEGPQLIGDINYGITKLMERDSFRNISEAVGKNARFTKHI